MTWMWNKMRSMTVRKLPESTPRCLECRSVDVLYAVHYKDQDKPGPTITTPGGMPIVTPTRTVYACSQYLEQVTDSLYSMEDIA